MAYTTIEIKTYQVSLFPQTGDPGKINLYDAKQANFATVFVRPDGEQLPKAYLDPGGLYRLYIHRIHYAGWIDLLRNEKPVYMHYWTAAGDNTHIGTDREPVGEAE